LSRVADDVISELVNLGVSHFFIVVGGNAMYLDDAIRLKRIPYTAFHNEQAAAMAAEAYARIKGEIAVCVVTSGPGATNLATGVAGAFLDSAPVFYIAGQAKSTETVTQEMKPGVRQFGTFELPALDILKPIIKIGKVLSSKDNIAETIKKMAQIALTGRPGPVYLEIPLDVQGTQSITKEKQKCTFMDGVIEADDTQEFIESLYLALDASLRPLILAGHGVRASGGQGLLSRLVDAWNMPIVTTQLAKDLFPHSDRHFIGHVGLRGDRAGNLAVFESDLLICIGTSLQQQTIGYDASLFAPHSKKYIVDFEKSISKKGLPFEIEQSVDSDTVDILSKLLNAGNLNSQFGDQFENWRTLNIGRKYALAVSLEPHDLTTPEINMYEFIDLLSIASDQKDIIVTDAGLCFYIMGQAFLLKEQQRYIVSGGLGAMGYALPASIGAIAAGVKRAICVTGDGSAQMNIHEFGTLASQNGNAIIFVINNGGYASIRNTQKSFFSTSLIGASGDSGVLMPIWEKVAEAYGLEFMKIEGRMNLLNKIKLALSINSPILVEVICQYSQGLMPAVSSFKLDDGTLKSNPLHVMSPNIDSTELTVELN
jgi:acetolactate synthase-1/2/3 large subunit